MNKCLLLTESNTLRQNTSADHARIETSRKPVNRRDTCPSLSIFFSLLNIYLSIYKFFFNNILLLIKLIFFSYNFLNFSTVILSSRSAPRAQKISAKSPGARLKDTNDEFEEFDRKLVIIDRHCVLVKILKIK